MSRLAATFPTATPATILASILVCLGGLAPAPAHAGLLDSARSTDSLRLAEEPAKDYASSLGATLLEGSEAPTLEPAPADDGIVFEPVDLVLPVYPSDASFPLLWGLQQIDAPRAWFFHTGSYQTVVAVVDTGIDYTHEDLYENIWLNENEIPILIRMQLQDVDGDGILGFRDLNDPVNQGPGLIVDSNANGRIDGGDALDQWSDGIDGLLDGNGYVDDLIGWDFVDDDNDPMDTDAHGTHVAGTIGAMANTLHPGGSGDDVVGVAWQVRLMAVRIPLTEGKVPCTDFVDVRSAAADGVRYSIDNGARIANHSWGASADWTLCDLPADLGLAKAVELLSEAFGYARDRHQLVVASAGNDGVDLDEEPAYPAAFGFDNLITVANTSSADALCPSPPSNYGARVDLAAPGCGILSATGSGAGVSVYGMDSGTSMAAPHVAGVAALVWDRNPEWTVDQVVEQVVANALPVSDLDGLVSSGGRLDALAAIAPGPWVRRALLLIDGSPAAGPSQAQACLGYEIDGLRVSFNEDVDPASFDLADVALVVDDADGIQIGAPPAILGVEPVASTCTTAADGSEGCRAFDVSITPLHVDDGNADLGSYEISIDPEIVDLEGVRLDLDRDGVDGESDDELHFAFSVGLVLPEACVGELIIDDIGVQDVQVPTDLSDTYVPEPDLVGTVDGGGLTR